MPTNVKFKKKSEQKQTLEKQFCYFPVVSGFHSPLEKKSVYWAPPTKKNNSKTQTISTKKNIYFPFVTLPCHSFHFCHHGWSRQPSPNNRLHQRRIRPQPPTSGWPCCLTALTPTTKLRLPIGHGKSAGPGSFTNLCYLTQR